MTLKQASSINGAAKTPSAESRLTQALEEYRALLEGGIRPDRQTFLARYPDLGASLADGLDGLEFVHAAAPSLSGNGTASADLSDAIQPSALLGDFRLIREIGRGGMGVVYEAEQISLGRRVALKVLPLASTMDSRQLQRFQNEARAAACLHHTNIVPVYYVGSERGVYYYAMQFIEGRDLASVMTQLREQAGHKAPDSRAMNTVDAAHGQAIALAPLPAAASRMTGGLSTEHSTRSLAYFRRVARLGIQAAEALDHAHQQGIVHRDIKPANLLVDAEGRLWVTDFGLAQVQSDTRLTMTGDLVGTLRYMSPEQALAKRVIVDHRTDIYSLGVTLYELLSLEPAFSGRDRQELLRQIAFEEPRRLRRWNRAIPRELETIVLKALERNPADRYGTAQELADDLERFLQDRPILARRPSLGQILSKWSHRHRGLVASAFGMLFVVALVLGAATAFIWQANHDAKEAEELAKRRSSDLHMHLPVERARANQAEATVRESVKTMEELLLAMDELEADPSPAAKQVREKAEGKALAYYGTVLQEHYISEEKSPLLAWAYVRLGNTCVRRQEFTTARKWYQRADAAFNESVQDARKRGEILLGMENPELEKGFRQAIAVWKKTAPTDAETVSDYRKRFVEYHGHEAWCWIGKDKLAEAQQAYTRGLANLDNMAADHPDRKAAFREQKLVLQVGYGDCLLRAGHLTAARKVYLEAFAFCQEIPPLGEEPGDVLLRMGYRLGRQLEVVDCLDEAEQSYRLYLIQYQRALARKRAIPVSMSLSYSVGSDLDGRVIAVAREPRNLIYLLTLVDRQHELASFLLSRGQHREAEAVARESLDVLTNNPTLRNEPALVREDVLAWGHMRLANVLVASRQASKANEEYRLALEAYEKALVDSNDQILKKCRGATTEIENNLAWLLATCPDAEIRDVKRAIELATRAVSQRPNMENYCNTLGVAHYRNGEWKSAIETLTHSAELGAGGDSFDFFFLAMAHWQLDDKEQARRWYDKAVEWMEKHKSQDEELRRFRAEAAELLGVKDPLPADEKKAPPPKP